jgi:single-strand DNA-binding protein
MANLNKVMLIGRLTRDPEVRTFSNGGKVAKFGFAVNNRRRNNQTGQWEDDPVFVDVDVFNRGDQGRQADLVEQSLRKGHQVFIEGHLKLDQWTSQDNQKRSRLHVVADNFQFLEPRTDGGGGGPRMTPAPRRSAAPAPPPDGYDEPESMEPSGQPGEADIPF